MFGSSSGVVVIVQHFQSQRNGSLKYFSRMVKLNSFNQLEDYHSSSSVSRSQTTLLWNMAEVHLQQVEYEKYTQYIKNIKTYRAVECAQNIFFSTFAFIYPNLQRFAFFLSLSFSICFSVCGKASHIPQWWRVSEDFAIVYNCINNSPNKLVDATLFHGPQSPQ